MHKSDNIEYDTRFRSRHILDKIKWSHTSSRSSSLSSSSLSDSTTTLLRFFFESESFFLADILHRNATMSIFSCEARNEARMGLWVIEYNHYFSYQNKKKSLPILRIFPLQKRIRCYFAQPTPVEIPRKGLITKEGQIYFELCILLCISLKFFNFQHGGMFF